MVFEFTNRWNFQYQIFFLRSAPKISFKVRTTHIKLLVLLLYVLYVLRNFSTDPLWYVPAEKKKTTLVRPGAGPRRSTGVAKIKATEEHPGVVVTAAPPADGRKVSKVSKLSVVNEEEALQAGFISMAIGKVVVVCIPGEKCGNV